MPRDFETDAEAFGVLASETRLRMLCAVSAYWGREGESMPYSTLQDAVDVPDSGKFNYHLDRLRGRFLQKERGGYTLTGQATRVLDPVAAKRFHDVENDRQSVAGRCPICGGGLEVGCHWNFYLGCENCWEPHLYQRHVAPAALEERDWRDRMLAVERSRRHAVAAMLEGTCSACGGPTGFRFHRLVDPYERAGTTMKTYRAVADCRTCVEHWAGSVGRFLLAHPAVREYCDDHGVDLDAEAFWRHEWTLTDLTTRARNDEPLEIEKVATVDDCRLAVVFSADGSVETVTHVDLRPGDRTGRTAADRSVELAERADV